MNGIDVFCCIVVMTGVIVAIVMANKGKAEVQEAAAQKSMEVDYARRQYRQTLEKLKLHPSDPEVKQEALKYGRKYSYLTRDKQGITLFDEMMLMNDINAATAHAFTNPPAITPQPVSNSQLQTSFNSPEERLKKLLDLKDCGIITQAEYTSRRNKILDDI